MANSVGAIAVNLGLDAAEFVRGLTKAEYETQKAMAGITRQIETVGRSVEHISALVGVGFGVHAIVAWGEAVVDSAEKLNNLSQETGSSVESLSKLQNIAKVSGTSFDEFRNIIDKFAAGLGGAEGQGSRVGEVMKLLGVQAKDPAAAMLETAKRLNEFADGANKAALAKDAFGRSGVQFLSTVRNIGEETGIAATRTAEQARAATELAESYRRLRVESDQLAQIFLTAVVPGLSEMLSKFIDARKGADGLYDTLKALSQLSFFGSNKDDIDYLDSEIGKLNKTITETKANATGFWASISPSRFDTSNLERELATLTRARDVAIAAQLRGLGGAPTNGVKGFLPNAPTLPAPGQADATARRALEQQLKAYDNIVKGEEDVLRDREHFLQAYYQDDLLGVEAYYAGRNASIDEAFAHEKAAYNASIRVLQDYAAKTDKPEERIRAETQIADIVARSAKLDRETAVARIDNYLQQNRAVRQFKESVEQLGVALANARGDTVGAATQGFDLQYRQQLDQIKANLGSSDPAIRAAAEQGQQRIADLRAVTIQQAQLNDATKTYTLTLTELGIAQQHIDNLVTAGGITELDALAKKTDANKAYIATLKAQLAAVEAIAQASGKREDIVRVAELKAQLEGLEAQGDLVAKKFKDIFETDGVNALDEFVNGTKSAKDAFHDFAKSLERDLTHIANQQIVKSLANSLFGASPGSSGSSGLLPLIISGIASFFGPDYGGYATGPGAPQVGGPGGNAAGTDYWRGGPTWVGERGPEIVNLPRGSQVIPNHKAMRGNGVNVTNHFVFSGPVDTRTQSQVGVAAGRGVERAVARFG